VLKYTRPVWSDLPLSIRWRLTGNAYAVAALHCLLWFCTDILRPPGDLHSAITAPAPIPGGADSRTGSDGLTPRYNAGCQQTNP